VRTTVARLRARLVDAFGQPFLVTCAATAIGWTPT
jgi:hypothetical protein